MKSILTIAALAASALAIPSAAVAQRAPAAVVVVVDSDRIYRECNACRTAQTQLQSRVAALQTRQQTLANQLRPEGQAIQTAVQALNGRAPDAALRARAEAFQKKQDDANQELGRTQQNLQSIQANVLRQINQRMNPVINQVMTARGANLAVDTDATLAHSASINVTAEVLAGLNRALPSVSLTPLPAQQQQPQGR
ncbi:OmpH family outer membrane protein [Sphingomonas sp.]|uniref:OmpH family outer membrane protein n=1 Tax=Sphingomonas sp. TaxID=28214 RepID=UPI001859A26F|nr:OmpH family outer membrane protein [Sphingomonas sp.]MBA3510841.1 OmpH family outer membrane protein [Sphingomonas sp.]